MSAHQSIPTYSSKVNVAVSRGDVKASESVLASEQGSGEKRKTYKINKLPRSKRSRTRARTSSNVRFKLPQIETYQKELEFQADGPGRVVVRLERLMGTDRVRLTDTKYMSTLLDRLETQERDAWTQRRLGRIKAEQNRFRQLAIDGLMEPGPEMQDLYHHPVFRVNRILNRLAKMDHSLTPVSGTTLPPIVNINPFENDVNGRSFINYPGHIKLSNDYGDSEITFRKSLESDASSKITYSKSLTSDRPIIVTKSKPSTFNSISTKSTTSLQTRISLKTLKPEDIKNPTLAQMQKRYGVKASSSLIQEWEPFQSPLVKTVFDDNGHNIYSIADDVLRVYRREQKATDQFLTKRNRMK